MFGKKKKETNYWMSYADLLTGLAIIFIIISIMLGGRLTECQGDLKDYTKRYSADSAQVAALKILDNTFSELENQTELFKYDKKNKIYKLEVTSQFGGNCSIKLKDSTKTKRQLIAAGDALQKFVENMYKKTQINLVIVIEGRAAKHLDGKNMKQNLEWNKRGAKMAKKCSLERAKYLFDLWNTTTELNNLDFIDLSIAGKGFGGKGRYPYKGKLEEKNKNFVVKIIPIFNPINK